MAVACRAYQPTKPNQLGGPGRYRGSGGDDATPHATPWPRSHSARCRWWYGISTTCECMGQHTPGCHDRSQVTLDAIVSHPTEDAIVVTLHGRQEERVVRVGRVASPGRVTHPRANLPPLHINTPTQVLENCQVRGPPRLVTEHEREEQPEERLLEQCPLRMIIHLARHEQVGQVSEMQEINGVHVCACNCACDRGQGSCTKTALGAATRAGRQARP